MSNPNLSISLNPYNKHFSVITNYLSTIESVYDKAQAEYPRLAVFRFDLRLPDSVLGLDNPNMPRADLMKRFFASLQSKLKASFNFRKHIRDQHLHYVWVKESGGQKNKDHYHVAVFLNKDDFGISLKSRYSDMVKTQPRMVRRRTGKDYKSFKECVQEAWASALNIDNHQGAQQVFFSTTACRWVTKGSLAFKDEYISLMAHLSYMAKPQSKQIGVNGRCIGTGAPLIYRSAKRQPKPCLSVNKYGL
ncbi:YagK/YfjJ domain-containing protein [Pseudoalteromonas sp. SS15]|uniref:YagK/YfjJ domain-containing protein n=1 Tax=Pseudoalteromonas sp. SS15 TaxID=3139393 RepID=UPI003BAC632A